jgi:hypothetical protein
MSRQVSTRRDASVLAPAVNLVGVAIACTISACGASAPRDATTASASTASSATASVIGEGIATLAVTNAELESLARGLTNEALQVKRAKELAEFSMELDTHAAALRAQTDDVTTAAAAELVGLPPARYRELRSAVMGSISGNTMPGKPGALPADIRDRARAVGVDAAWAEYIAAVAADGSHRR